MSREQFRRGRIGRSSGEAAGFPGATGLYDPAVSSITLLACIADAYAHRAACVRAARPYLAGRSGAARFLRYCRLCEYAAGVYRGRLRSKVEILRTGRLAAARRFVLTGNLRAWRAIPTWLVSYFRSRRWRISPRPTAVGVHALAGHFRVSLAAPS